MLFLLQVQIELSADYEIDTKSGFTAYLIKVLSGQDITFMPFLSGVTFSLKKKTIPYKGSLIAENLKTMRKFIGLPFFLQNPHLIKIVYRVLP